MMQNQKYDFIEKTVQIRRVTKVVKGGRRFGFSALVVVGDGSGKVGYAMGKANEVSEAIKKASRNAKKKLKEYAIHNGTIPHRIIGRFCSGSVLLRPMPPGSGIIASLPARAVVEALGVSDVNIKALKSSNAINVVKATIAGLSKLRSFEEISKLRGKEIKASDTIKKETAEVNAALESDTNVKKNSTSSEFKNTKVETSPKEHNKKAVNKALGNEPQDNTANMHSKDKLAQKANVKNVAEDNPPQTI